MKIIQSKPSLDGHFTLLFYVEDNEIHFQDGEMALNHTSFCLESADGYIFFRDFTCLYQYGSIDYWDATSRYFCLASGVKTLFVFDCKENRCVEIQLPFYLQSAEIKEDSIHVNGTEEIDMNYTLNGELISLSYPIAELHWENTVFKIEQKKVENKELDLISKQNKEEVLFTSQRVQAVPPKKTFNNRIVTFFKIENFYKHPYIYCRCAACNSCSESTGS